MSRGSVIYYVSGLTDIYTQETLNTELNAQAPDAQWGDVAVEKDTITQVDPSDASLHRRAMGVFQFDGTNWTQILDRASSDPSTETRTAYNNETITALETAIRKAHMDEIRSYLSFIQRVYTNRFGDTWYNTHNLSKAITKWDDGTGTSVAKIFMGNYGAGDDEKYLTLEFGGTDTAKMKFIHRDAVGSIVDILTMAKTEVRSVVKLIAEQDAVVSQDLYVGQKISGSYLVNRSQYFYLYPSDNLDENTGAPTDGKALGVSSGKLVINYGGDFANGTEFQGAKIDHNNGSVYRVWTEEYEGHQTDNPDSKGIDACKLHGFHGDETDTANTIPVRTSGAKNIIEGTIRNALSAEGLVSPIYYDVAYIESFTQLWDQTYTFDCTTWKDDFMTNYGTANGIDESEFRVIAIPHLYTSWFKKGYGNTAIRFMARFLDWDTYNWMPRIKYGAQRYGQWGTAGGSAEIFLIGGWQNVFKYWDIL